MPVMEICAECNLPIQDQFVLRVGDCSLHQDCLKCAACRAPLTDSCFSKFGSGLIAGCLPSGMIGDFFFFDLGLLYKDLSLPFKWYELTRLCYSFSFAQIWFCYNFVNAKCSFIDTQDFLMQQFCLILQLF